MTTSASYTYSDWKLDVPATPYNDNLRGGGGTKPRTRRRTSTKRKCASHVLQCAETVGPSRFEFDSHSPWHVGNSNNGYNNQEQQQRLQQRRRGQQVRDEVQGAMGVGIYNDKEDGVMEEAERTLVALMAVPDAL